jgi:nucleotide-binding universal stress UspA family protein
MCTNILVPLDGSPLAEAALPYAQWLAERGGASLTLVRATRAPLSLGDAGFQERRAVAETEAYLAALAGELVAHGFRVQTGVPYGGSAAAWIVEEVAMRHADMVVMATHERSGPDRWLHGSVAEAVVGQAGAPVLLIRVPTSPRAVERFRDQRPVLVVPLDGSSLAEAALPGAVNLARTLGGRILLVGVVPIPGQRVAIVGGEVAFVGSEHTQLVNDTRGYLARIVDHLADIGLTAEALVCQGEPAEAIAEAAAKHSAAAVVMATHGLTGLARTIMGSVAGEVLHRTACPVLLVRSIQPEMSHVEETVGVESVGQASP